MLFHLLSLIHSHLEFSLKHIFLLVFSFFFEKQHYDLRDIESLRQFKDIVFFKSIRNPQFYLPDINGELCIKG